MARPKRDAQGFFSVTMTVGRDATGKRVRKRIRSKTLAGLAAKRAQFELERAQGMNHTSKKPTVKEFLLDWLEHVVKLRNRPRVYDRYAAECHNHLIPRIGTIRLDVLTGQDVQRMINDVALAGRIAHKNKPKEAEGPKDLSPRTVRNIHATLRNALDTAVKWGIVARNVASLADVPPAQKPHTEVLSPDQAYQLLNVVKEDRLEALYWVALLLGLRQGELLGLRWADIDFEKNAIRISGAIQRQKQAEGKSKLVFVPTKTDAGRRTLPLPVVLKDVLQAHRARQDEERVWDEWQENGLVFASERGTPLEAQNMVNRSFKPALKAAGLADMRFHALRHSCATLLLSMGVDHNTVSAILGHTSAAFTVATYGHALPELTRTAIAELGDVLRTNRVLELAPKKEPSSG